MLTVERTGIGHAEGVAFAPFWRERALIVDCDWLDFVVIVFVRLRLDLSRIEILLNLGEFESPFDIANGERPVRSEGKIIFEPIERFGNRRHHGRVVSLELTCNFCDRFFAEHGCDEIGD